MTTDLATYPETVGASFSRPDPVRSRVKYEQPLTNYEKQHPFVFEETPSRTFRIPLPEFKLPKVAFKPTDRPRGTHPGDVFYWVTCLGGVCLLLLAATR